MQRGITDREPRKTGQHISAQQLRRDPGRRNQQHPPPAVRRTATPQQPADRKTVERHKQHQQHISENGKRQRRIAVVIKTDIDPIQTAGEKTEGEQPAIKQRTLPRRLLPQPAKHGERQECRPAKRKRRERKSEKQAGKRRKQQIPHREVPKKKGAHYKELCAGNGGGWGEARSGKPRRIQKQK